MKNKLSINMFLTIVIACALFSIATAAQNKSDDIIAGRKVKIFSKILNEEREILISLPNGYEQSAQRYPVVYIADGSEFKLIALGGMIQYLSYWEMPQMIAVFIPNTDRGRDYSISVRSIEQVPNSGGKGGENFLKFLTEELITFIDANYRSTDYRIFVGYSATAGFVFNTLLTKPEYFDAYIAASPSIFFEDELLYKTKEFFLSHKTLNKFLFIPYYEKDYKTTTSILPKINKIIKENLPKDFRYQTKRYKGQAHIPKTALLDGLLALFKNWEHVKNPEIIPSNGLLQEGKSIKAEIRGYDNLIYYTLDGTEPTRESFLYTEPIVILKPVTLKVKSFRSNLSESDCVTSEFKYGPKPIPEKNIFNFKNGLNCKYYERRWYNLPDSISVEPTRIGICKTFEISSRTKEDGFLFQFDGYINITRAGLYRFYLKSTVSSKLFLSNEKIIENSFSKASNDPLYNVEEYSYGVDLEPGYYNIKALYTNAWHNGQEFKVSYDGPGINKQEINSKVLFHKEN